MRPNIEKLLYVTSGSDKPDNTYSKFINLQFSAQNYKLVQNQIIRLLSVLKTFLSLNLSQIVIYLRNNNALIHIQ